MGMMTDSKIKIDQYSDVPIWVQIRTRVLHQIATGYFQPGQQLPTVRELAAEVNANYNTVNKVYKDLERDGYIVSQRGRGSFVADLGDFLCITTISPIDAAAEEYIQVCEEHAISGTEMVEVLQKRLRMRSSKAKKGMPAVSTEPAGAEGPSAREDRATAEERVNDA